MNPRIFAALVIVLSIFVVLASAVVEQSDNTNVAVPVNNGTSSSVNVSGRMQQYVGFYGTMTMQVRKDTTAGNVMYAKRVTSGRMYWVRATIIPQFPSTYSADNDSKADGNISLTGYYVTGNHYVNNGTVCGYNNTNFINSTDNYSTGLFADVRNSTVAYYFCTNISNRISGNGFGDVDYEVVVPKTGTYTAYDVWFDLQ